MRPLLTIIISSMFSLFVFSKKEKNKRFIYIAAIIIFVGSFVRLYQIDAFPLGLNQDEASIGYEAFSLASYGIDRAGMSWPIHFVSWGSGQNALYAYLILPFIKLAINNSLTIRLPMAIIGCISLILVFIFVRKTMPNEKGLVVLFLFATMPWHIMKSRWGLESNIFPDLILGALICMYFGIHNKKRFLMILSSAILGLSTYAYGTSYLFVPILLIFVYGYLLKIKKIKFREVVGYFLITTIIALPMILFVIINYFKLNTINIGVIVIPRLPYNRFTAITSVNGNFISNCIDNFLKVLRITFYQKDGMPLNYMDGFGIFYLFSLPLLVYGIIIYFKKYREYKYVNVIFITLVCGLLVGMMVDGNINRLNIIWLPMMAFIIMGVIDLTGRNKYLKIIIYTVYLISFVLFNYHYFGDYQDKIAMINNYGLEDSILSIDQSEDVYITDTINQPYIFWLYYKKISPYYYIDNSTILNKNAMFHSVKEIGEVHFYLPDTVLNNGTYIVSDYEIGKYVTNQCDTDRYNNYVVLKCAN